MAQIRTKFIANDAVTGAKIRLDNNEALRARNAGDSADVELMKFDTSDTLQFLSHPRISTSASNNDDVLTLKDLNQELEGLKPKEAVRAATTANITLSGTQTIDGVALSAGDRVLVKDQTVASQNGIYVVDSGSWSRASDMDAVSPVNEVNGAYTFVQEGTDNLGKGFVQQGAVSTIDSDAINFVYFNSAANLSGGDGIDITSEVISIDHDGEGLTFSTGQLSLELDGSSLSKSSSGLEVADGGITEIKLGSDVDAESLQVATGYTPSAGTVTVGDTVQEALEKLDANTAAKQDPVSGGDGIDVTSDVISVDLDGSTLASSASGLKVADGGIDELQLSSNVDAESFVVATGYTAASGNVAASDTVQEALEKIEGKVDAISVPTISRDSFTLTGTDITNGYVDLSATPLADSVMFEVAGAPSQIEGTDWSVSTNRITFLGDLASGGNAALESGDVLQVTYRS